MIAARLAALLYLFVAAFGGGDAAPPLAPAGGDRLMADASPAHGELQSADPDADDDDDDLGDVDFDDDCLPTAAAPVLVAAQPSGRLMPASSRTPRSALRDPLFRPPRAPSV